MTDRVQHRERWQRQRAEVLEIRGRQTICAFRNVEKWVKTVTTHGVRSIWRLWLHAERLDITTCANEGLRPWYGDVVLRLWLDVKGVLGTRSC